MKTDIALQDSAINEPPKCCEAQGALYASFCCVPDMELTHWWQLHSKALTLYSTCSFPARLCVLHLTFCDKHLLKQLWLD